MTPDLPRLLVVLDPHLAHERGLDPLQLGLRMLDAGAPLLWLRDHPGKAPLKRALVPELRKRAEAVGARLIRSDVAGARADASGDGLHLSAQARAGGAICLERARAEGHHPLGASLHAGDDPAAPACAGLDYATLSPLRATPSKPGYGPALGPRHLRDSAARAPFPIFALGGATPADLALLPPVHGIAMMGPLHCADPAAGIREALRILNVPRSGPEP